MLNLNCHKKKLTSFISLERVCHFRPGLSYNFHVFGVNIDSHLDSWGCHNSEYPFKTHLKGKYREKSFAQNLCLNRHIILILCTEDDSITAVLSVKFRNDWGSEMDAMDQEVLNAIWVSQGNPILQAIASASWEA